MFDVLRVCSGWAAIFLGCDVVRNYPIWDCEFSTETDILDMTPYLMDSMLTGYRNR